MRGSTMLTTSPMRVKRAPERVCYTMPATWDELIGME